MIRSKVSFTVFALCGAVSLAAAQPKAPEKKAAPPAMPKPPDEIAALAKVSAGTWKCSGEMYEAGAKMPVTAVNKVKVDLDKWWVVENLEVKSAMPFKLLSYTTFDATAKKWRRVAVDNMGGQMIGTADAGPPNAKMTFHLESTGMMGTHQFRDHVDPTDMKAGLKVWGEISMDKGKTWNKVYEMTCKK